MFGGHRKIGHWKTGHRKTGPSSDTDPRSKGISKAGLSNGAIIARLFQLAWRYRWACAALLALQMALMATAITSVQLGGAGIDLVRFHRGDIATPPAIPWNLPIPEVATASVAELSNSRIAPPSNLALLNTSSPHGQIAVVAVWLLLVAVLRGVLNTVYAFASGHVINRQIVVDLRQLVYAKLQRLSWRFYDSQPASTIINRVTSDVQSTRQFIDGVIIQISILILSLVCYLTLMIQIHPGLTIACLATTPALWVLSARFSRHIRPHYERNRKLFDRLVLRVAEAAEGIQVIKAFGRQAHQLMQFDRANERVRTQQRAIFWRVSLFSPVVQLLTQVNLVVLLIYGGILVSQGRLPIGAGLVVFAGLLQQFSSQIANVSGLANSIQQSLTGARRVFEVLDAREEVAPPDTPALMRKVRGAIELQRVSFGFEPTQPVLHQLQLAIHAGERIAILGSVGAGKSTLLHLLPRFYDPCQGRILLDGVDLRDFHPRTLRRQFGLVFQESFLFSNTIAANIAFGAPDISRTQMVHAARLAQAASFIEALPNGYDTVLGEFGLSLSGGQRQRLALARALALDPPILLLDDPTASIDAGTEHELLDAIESAMAGRTTIICANRLSTLRRADRVVVLDRGRIVQVGRHDQLIQQPGIYQKVAASQGIDLVAA
jgi:ATP-binding cassette, subfamily B, bacterial